jgi:hypothetical protein
VVIPTTDFPQADAKADTTLCSAALPLLLTLGIADASGGLWTYLWTNAAGDTLANTPQYSATIDSTENYFLTVLHPSAPAGCNMARDTARVTVETPVTAPALTDVSVCRNEAVQIGTNPLVGFAYFWSPGVGLSDSLIADPVAAVQSSVIYTLTLVNTAMLSSCKVAFASQNVIVDACNLPTVLVSGQSLSFSGFTSPVKLTVYDDVGRLIYKTNDYRNDLNAERLSRALYFYVVESGGEVYTKKLLVLH